MLSGVDGAIEMYKRFLAAAKKTDCCPLCRRGFHDNSELEVLVKKVCSICERGIGDRPSASLTKVSTDFLQLDELMIKQPQQAQGMQREILDLEERLSQLKRLLPSYEKLIQLRDTQLDTSKTAVAELQVAKRGLATETERVCINFATRCVVLVRLISFSRQGERKLVAAGRRKEKCAECQAQGRRYGSPKVRDQNSCGRSAIFRGRAEHIRIN